LYVLLYIDVTYGTAVHAFPPAVGHAHVVAIDAAAFIPFPVDAVLLAALLHNPIFVGADPRADVRIETEFLSVAAIDIPQVAAFFASHVVDFRAKIPLPSLWQ